MFPSTVAYTQCTYIILYFIRGGCFYFLLCHIRRRLKKSDTHYASRIEYKIKLQTEFTSKTSLAHLHFPRFPRIPPSLVVCIYYNHTRIVFGKRPIDNKQQQLLYVLSLYESLWINRYRVCCCNVITAWPNWTVSC